MNIAALATDTGYRLRALALVNRLGELSADARELVLDAWEDTLETALNPTILVVSPRDDVAARWIQTVSDVGGVGCRVTDLQEVTEALCHDHVREKGIPVVLVTLPHKLWMLGDNGYVRRTSPALEDIRRTLTEVLGRGRATVK